MTSIIFSFRYNSSSLRFGLIPFPIPKQNIYTHEIGQGIPVMVEDALRWPRMGGTYLEVLGCLGTALVDLLGESMDFSTVDAFGMFLETGLTFVFFGMFLETGLSICFVSLYDNGSPYICDDQVGYSAGGYSLSPRWFLTWCVYPFFQD